MMALSLTACGNADSTAPEENGSGTQTAAGSYTVGICQQMQHAALDSATQGFQDKLKELITRTAERLNLKWKMPLESLQTALPSSMALSPPMWT